MKLINKQGRDIKSKPDRLARYFNAREFRYSGERVVGIKPLDSYWVRHGDTVVYNEKDFLLDRWDNKYQVIRLLNESGQARIYLVKPLKREIKGLRLPETLVFKEFGFPFSSSSTIMDNMFSLIRDVSIPQQARRGYAREIEALQLLTSEYPRHFLSFYDFPFYKYLYFS